jgi:AcrR family transcriptional regulator
MAGRVKDQEKARLIAAEALRCFGEKGYGATSVEEIARGAGVGKGSVYTYFKTKDDLFIAAITSWLDRYHKTIDGLMTAIPDPVRRLKRIVTLCAELFDPDNPETLRIAFEMLKQAMTVGGVLHKRRHILKELGLNMRRNVQDTLLEGVSAGIFRPEIARDTEKIAINLLAYLDGIMLHAMVSDRYFDLNTQIESFMEMLMSQLLVMTGRES